MQTPIIIAHQFELRSIDQLTPNIRNARTHSAKQVSQIAASIREYGFTNPVLIDRDNSIIAGHGRVLGSSRGWNGPGPVIVLDHLTEIQKRAYAIADNKLALNSEPSACGQMSRTQIKS